MWWKKYDADGPNPYVDKLMYEFGCDLLREANVNCSDSSSCLKHAVDQQEKYRRNEVSCSGKVFATSVFRPSEFSNSTDNDASLVELQNFLRKSGINARRYSKVVQNSINNNFMTAGNRSIAGGRASVNLDCLVQIGNKNVAIEVEFSTNLDNGIYTLRQAVRCNKADYGVMIVPFFSEGPGRADEAKAIDKLDREFSGATDLRDGPIYNVSLIRIIDVYRWVIKRKGAVELDIDPN